MIRKGDLTATDLSFSEIERLVQKGRIERAKAFQGFFSVETAGKAEPRFGGLRAPVTAKA